MIKDRTIYERFKKMIKRHTRGGKRKTRVRAKRKTRVHGKRKTRVRQRRCKTRKTII